MIAPHDDHHEGPGSLSVATLDLHRAILSLCEELEAVDWYHQRAEACGDADLRAVITHNENEEVEHAMMVLEWIRRKNPVFDANIAKFLGRTGSIVAGEGSATASPAPAGADLGVGSLRGSK